MVNNEDLFKKIIGHCKEYGFIFQSSEIYDGLSAAYDYGPNGVELKNNIKNYWWKSMVNMHKNIVGIDSSIFMHPRTWKASGHIDAFNDPLIDNKDSKKRYRADVLIENYIEKICLNVLNQSKQNLILNVNFPSKVKTFKGIKICRQAKGYWKDNYDKRISPLGKEYYWLTGSFINQDKSEETDEWALDHGFVSVVPISYDMTSYSDLEEIKNWKLS